MHNKITEDILKNIITSSLLLDAYPYTKLTTANELFLSYDFTTLEKYKCIIQVELIGDSTVVKNAIITACDSCNNYLTSINIKTSHTLQELYKRFIW